MDLELIQSWLQLPPGNWPPDHYALLGLKPGEADLGRVEQQVHERMERLRSYQLTHPELATQAMNCLAQALVCLTDPAAKKNYDRELFSKQRVDRNVPAVVPVTTNGSVPASALAASPAVSSNGPVPPATAEGPADDQRFFDWQTEPPPQRQPQISPLPPSLEFMNTDTAENFALPGLGAGDTFPDVPPVPALDSGAKATQEDLLRKFSRLGLRSKGALYYQIARTRQLLWAWEQVGKYLSRPSRLVGRPAEATDLIHHMGVIRDLLPTTPLLLGEAGHPGYLVLALARQQMIVPTLQTLLPSQRQALARDWQSCHDFLRTVRQFLRQELRVVRARRGWRHALRVIGASLRDHPGVLLFLLALVAANLASPAIFERWPEQLICLGALAAIKLSLWVYSLQPHRLPPFPSPERKLRLPRKRSQARAHPDSSRA
jgi:hypothetical protein